MIETERLILRKPRPSDHEALFAMWADPAMMADLGPVKDRAMSEATLARIDLKPLFTFDDSTPHPRIPEGTFEATWTGLVFLRDPGPFVFDAYVCGEVEIEVDGVSVLAGTGKSMRDRVGPGETAGVLRVSRVRASC